MPPAINLSVRGHPLCNPASNTMWIVLADRRMGGASLRRQTPRLYSATEWSAAPAVIASGQINVLGYQLNPVSNCPDYVNSETI
jgi:hypothetical protein